MHDILISSPAFSKDKSHQYILSIQLSLDGFSFSICDTISNKFIFLKHKPFSSGYNNPDYLKEILRTEDELKLSFKKTTVCYNLSPSTNIPHALYDAGYNELYYSKNYKTAKGDKLFNDFVKINQSVNVYPVNEHLLDTLQTAFPNHTLQHLNTIKNTINLRENTGSNCKIYLTVMQERFSMFVIKDGSVLLENSFNYQNDDEFLYFFLYSFKQLELDQLKAEVIIDGLVPRHASIVKHLERFIKKVSFAQWPLAFNFANDFYDMPSHYFTYLYHSQLCE